MRRIIIVSYSILVTMLAFTYVNAAEPTDQEKLDRIYRNFKYIFVGHFIQSDDHPVMKCDEDSLDTQNDVIKQFNVKKVLKIGVGMNENEFSTINVVVPCFWSLINQKTFRQYTREMYSAEDKLVEIENGQVESNKRVKSINQAKRELMDIRF